MSRTTVIQCGANLSFVPMSFRTLTPRLGASGPFWITSILGIFGCYGASLWHWLSHLPGWSEDAVKNYYTLAYHVVHSEHFLWFDGMNYPEGEHLIFTDNQPLFALMLKAIQVLIPLDGALPWLLPLMLVSSYFIGGYLLYKSADSGGGASSWFAALGAVGIMLLAPQWQRFSGHYSLAYAFVTPLVLFALKRWSEGDWKPRRIVWILLAIGFIHPYFIAMHSFFVGAFALVFIWANRAWNSTQLWRDAAWMSVFPLAVFQLILWISDPITDRPDSPFGFLDYRATLRSIILPLDQSLPNDLLEYVNLLGPQSLEGSFYIGLFALVGLITMIWSRREGQQSIWLLFFIASLPVLFLAMALPFSVWKVDRLLPFTGPLQQFRGIGRFAFVFFFAINALALIRLQAWSRLHNWKRYIAWLALIILWAEGIWYSRYIADVTQHGSSAFSETAAIGHLEPDYAVILPLPYYHTGSEQFRSPEPSDMLEASMVLSQASGVPLFSVQMSRTSLQQSVEHIKIVKHIMEPPHEAYLTDKKWLLLVDTSAALPPNQRQMIAQSSFVEFWKGYGLYAFYPSSIGDILEANADAARYLSQSAVAPHDHDQVIYRSVEVDERGKGIPFNRMDWTCISEQAVQLKYHTPYELTFWMPVVPGAMNTQIWHWERDAEGNEIDFHVSEVGDHVLGFVNNAALCRVVLEPEQAGNLFELLLHRDGENTDLWLNQILLRPLDVNVTLDEPYDNINNRIYLLNDARTTEASEHE